MAAEKPKGRAAIDVQAMRRALHVALRTEERPAWCRDLWTAKGCEIEAAIELVERGGYARDGVTVDGIVGLASWGIVEWFPRKGWCLRSDVMADYLKGIER